MDYLKHLFLRSKISMFLALGIVFLLYAHFLWGEFTSRFVTCKTQNTRLILLPPKFAPVNADMKRLIWLNPHLELSKELKSSELGMANCSPAHLNGDTHADWRYTRIPTWLLKKIVANLPKGPIFGTYWRPAYLLESRSVGRLMFLNLFSLPDRVTTPDDPDIMLIDSQKPPPPLSVKYAIQAQTLPFMPNSNAVPESLARVKIINSRSLEVVVPDTYDGGDWSGDCALVAGQLECSYNKIPAQTDYKLAREKISSRCAATLETSHNSPDFQFCMRERAAFYISRCRSSTRAQNLEYMKQYMKLPIVVSSVSWEEVQNCLRQTDAFGSFIFNEANRQALYIKRRQY